MIYNIFTQKQVELVMLSLGIFVATVLTITDSPGWFVFIIIFGLLLTALEDIFMLYDNYYDIWYSDMRTPIIIEVQGEAILVYECYYSIFPRSLKYSNTKYPLRADYEFTETQKLKILKAEDHADLFI